MKNYTIDIYHNKTHIIRDKRVIKEKEKYLLEGKVGLALYDERLQIDLNAIADLIVDDGP